MKKMVLSRASDDGISFIFNFFFPFTNSASTLSRISVCYESLKALLSALLACITKLMLTEIAFA